MLAAAVYFYVSSTTETATPSPSSAIPWLTPSPAVQLADWQDEAGYTFRYPQNLKVNNHPEDDVNYSHLEFTSSQLAGSLVIIMQDNTYANLDTWSTSGTTITLADRPAKKVTASDGSLRLGVVDGDVLLTINAPVSWQLIFDQIASTLAFFQPTPQTNPPAASANSDILEEDSGD